MALLVTGASGFLGTVLIEELLKKGHRVYGLSRHPPQAKENLVPLVGDITEPHLGLETVPEDIEAVYHLAGIHSLRQVDRDGAIWTTNVLGTQHVLELMVHHNIPRLAFTSTAYTWPANPYGLSKIRNEEDIEEYTEKYGLKATIFKPSIVMGHFYPGHFSQFVSAVIKIHQRAELVRRKIEGTLRLPVLEPVFRIKGDPDGKLNLIQIDQVAWGMANIKHPGVYWLTNPNPPTLKQLVEWVGEFIMVDLRILPHFQATPIEAQFAKLTNSFAPYLWGDDFPSHLKDCPPITKQFIEQTLAKSLVWG